MSTSEGRVNTGFEEEARRKLSVITEREREGDKDREKEKERKTSDGSGGPRSILVNGDTTSYHSHHSHDHTRSLSITTEEHPKPYTYDPEENVTNSWRCPGGWELPPSSWNFCPSHRHLARMVSLLLLGLLTWGSAYAILGEDLAPGGPLFDISILCISAHFGGWICRKVAMPGLVGMLLVGIIFQNIGIMNINHRYLGVISVLRRLALVVILTRAGLDLDSEAMKRLWWPVLKIGLIPWSVECLIVAILAHYFLTLPWIWAFLLGSIVAAVSPAVVVPCLIRLRNKGYGVAKGIPSLIIAISGIDDAASVAGFGIIHSIMFSSNSLIYEVFLGLFSIVVGIAYGVVWGFLASYIPEKEDPFVVPLRILSMLGGGLLAVLGFDLIGLGGAGPLGCIAAAFLSAYAWSKQGWDVEDNPVATAFEIFWMIFEPILFSLTGMQIKINEMDPNLVMLAGGILLCACILRIILTCLVAFGASLNLKEKLFSSLALMSKASVQAALGPVALDLVRDRPGPEPEWAYIVSLMCVMSILMTAPTGAILITLTGKTLLTKGPSVPDLPEDWTRRHSTRPSLRDITIFTDGHHREGGSCYSSSNKDNTSLQHHHL